MIPPLIQVVNENDEPVGGATKDEIHQKGLLHRIVYIMIEDPGHTKVLLQKRSKFVKTYPNCWDVSASGHVDEGEDYLEAAKRELQEELGVNGLELHEIGSYRSQDKFNDKRMNRFNRGYNATMAMDTPLKLQTAELGTTDWINIKSLKALLQEEPNEFAAGARLFIERFYLT